MYIDTARALGEAFDPLMDTLLQHLLKLSGSTKKIVAEASQQVTTAIIDYAGCHPRVFVPFLEAGLGERTVQSRQYFMAHVARYMATQAKRPLGKQTIEQTSLLNSSQPTALAQLTDLIRRGLTDPSSSVKESARSAFVVFYREWPKQGAALLGGLEEGVRRQVDKALAGAATTVDVQTKARIDSTEQQASPTTASVSVPAPARRAPAARKPSSAIAAAIRKAKEEARAARLAEAEAEAQARAEDDERGEDATNPQQEVVASDGKDGSLEGETTRKNGVENSVVDTSDPVESQPDSIPRSPAVIPASLPAPETPVKHVSLLDFQTPGGSSTAFKVMTPAPAMIGRPDLLETTGITLLEPPESIAADASPTPDVAERPADPVQERLAIPPDAPKQRRPRVSVNPVAQMERPKPLYAKLRTLVDCSFWLDRRQGEC